MTVRPGLPVTSLHVRRGISITACLALSAIVIFGVRWYRDNYVPVAYPTVHIPDAEKYGDPEGAIRICYELLTLHRKAGWDSSKIPWEKKHLPDQKIAESPMYRRLGNSPFAFSDEGDPNELPGMKPISFFTDMYVRTNPAAYKGDRVKTKPTGFYIVAWKKGQVTTVPIEQVKVVKIADGRRMYAFPGMPEYETATMHVPEVEFTTGQIKDNPKAWAFYKPSAKEIREDKAECPTCTEKNLKAPH